MKFPNTIALLKTNILLKILFIFITYLSFTVTNLFYNSTQSPDFAKYKNYIDYYLGSNIVTNLEQGNLYFYLISLSIDVNSNNLSIRNIEEYLSYRVQLGNFVIYIFFILGLYKLLKFYKISENNIYTLLIVLNFFPPLLALRIIFKPEILILSLFVYCLYYIENFLKNRSYTNVFYFWCFFSLILSTKFTPAIMICGFIAISYFKIFITKHKNITIISFLMVTILFLILSFENYDINGLAFYESERQYSDLYESKPKSNFLYNINISDLVFNPIKNYHSDSMIGIVLLETFDDYFHLYWNNDESLFSKNELFNSNNYRIFTGVFLTLLYFFYAFFLSFKNRKFKRYYLSPLIGIVTMYLISNFVLFNSQTGDMMKNYYYAFFLVISFSFSFISLLIRFNRLKYPIIALFIISNIYIFGFPKSIDLQFKNRMSEQNSALFTCDLNADLFGLNNKKCTKQLNICDDIFMNYKKTEIINGQIINIELDAFNSFTMYKNLNEVKIDNILDCQKFVEEGWSLSDQFTRKKEPPYLSILFLLFPILIEFFILFKNKFRT